MSISERLNWYISKLLTKTPQNISLLVDTLLTIERIELKSIYEKSEHPHQAEGLKMDDYVPPHLEPVWDSSPSPTSTKNSSTPKKIAKHSRSTKSRSTNSESEGQMVTLLEGCSTNSDLVELGEIIHRYR